MLEKIIKTIAGIISIITSPLIMPTYGMAISLWGTYLAFAPAATRWQVLLLTFAATTMLPVIVIFVLSKAGIIKHPSLNDRNDRPYVYAAAAMAYLGVSFYLGRINSPLCFRNITLHNNEWLFVAAVLIAGAVMTSRLILERHTLGQVVAGFFNGALWVSVLELLAK